ncbi:TPA: NirD/YgiW/YdeI family stress tolerance protein [Vibrio parahaemolyticus]|uniref:NirD/YgiW/YdeI family stress tolerance protein n=3 Tax=Vibrio parahaemolyticus TaxID=670 RepID=UPI0011234EC5|nr:NirD/YgiW/YdeI family stress tolerance protein [Vibrio parahaemolyticus]EHZ2593623.1 NirD/YgiW/YdeI family stress tolerance protein [Vibrio parahaemolyticus]EJM7150155.1 NirD/YgiW/YdeI family stress tolerance protein [Vibrio parahaemolyticus]MDF4355847.1 NirD/YgiW/YdeI family stress tolerance protein [Vibrio parahaemolyticus]MDF4545252.1 NirD/YgiW/YdeI family stress tolerance protein [Vibrio parahaemolyticus]MDG2579368.1 NirD/YgiW/YdeI family stress tolerance protein [Vibrio parahaemolyticu
MKTNPFLSSTYISSNSNLSIPPKPNQEISVSSKEDSSPIYKITNVKQVLNIEDLQSNLQVTLTGYVKAPLGNNMYQFMDDTGSIDVKIDSIKWLRQSITSITKVQLTGKIEKKHSIVKVNVDTLRIL